MNVLQYETIMRKYENRRRKNALLLEEKKNRIYAQCPELLEIDARIRDLCVEEARNRLNGKSAELPYRQALEKLNDRRNALLQEIGVTAQELEGIYDCPICKDTGYTPEGKCECFRREISRMLAQESSITIASKGKSFQSFRLDFYSDQKQDPKSGKSERELAGTALVTCMDYAEHFAEQYKNLILTGKPGVGKTLLTNCIASELLRRDFSVIYMTAHDLFAELAEDTFGKEDRKIPAADYLYDCDLLIIDDLGTELTNKFVASGLFICLSERARRRRGTIISTNLSLREIAEVYSERIFSRIVGDYQLVRLVGSDIRVKQKTEKL